MKLLSLSFFLLLNACAFMHHTQVGDVDSDVVLTGQRFEVLVSEMGFDFEEAANIGANIVDMGTVLTKGKAGDKGGTLKKIQEMLALFQMGPKTGNTVFSPSYADKIFEILKAKCPDGRISGLTSIRETTKYPVVSGEIVKIIGYCKI